MQDQICDEKKKKKQSIKRDDKKRGHGINTHAYTSRVCVVYFIVFYSNISCSYMYSHTQKLIRTTRKCYTLRDLEKTTSYSNDNDENKSPLTFMQHAVTFSLTGCFH
jgi:uncharacterized ion transporter superfamily protein YfcC